MTGKSPDPLFSAAVLKLSFILKNLQNTPGFTFVYKGTLRELGVTDEQVDMYIEENRSSLEQHIENSIKPDLHS